MASSAVCEAGTTAPPEQPAKTSVNLKDLVGGPAPAARGGHHGFDTALESYDFHGESLPKKHGDLQDVGVANLIPCSIIDEVARMSLWKWFLTMFIAVIIAGSAALLIICSHEIVHAKVLMMDRLFNDGLFGTAACVWMIYGVCAATVSSYMVVYYEPTAGGSGIPDVKSYCNGVILPGVLRFRTYCIRIVGLILVTSSGLFAGTEGPMAHVGAIVAAGISMGRFTSCKKRLRLQEDLNTHKVKLEFMGMGAAMGVAAAFGAPIGGLLFSLEEASTHWNVQLTWRTFFGCCIASLFTKACKGGFVRIPLAGFIEFPTHTGRSLSLTRNISDPDNVILGDPVRWRPWELLPFLFIAVCMGLLGAHFCWAVKKIQQLRMKVFKMGTKQVNKPGRVLEVFFISVFSLGICWFLATGTDCQPNPYPLNQQSSAYMSWAGTGSAGSAGAANHGRRLQASDLIADQHNSYLNFRMHTYDASCAERRPNGYRDSNAIAMYFFESREFAIKALFSDEMDNGIFTDWQLIVLLITTYILTLMTYGSGIPAGLFIPNIMNGACFGRLIGQIVQVSVQAIDPTIHVNPGVYALMGSAAMLGGFTRMTMSLAVIVLEITTNMLMTLPVMMVIVVAKATGDLFTASTYDIVIALKNIPLLEPEIETMGWKKLATLPVSGIGCPQSNLQFIEFNKAFTVQRAVELLVQTRHHAWPVVDSADTMRLLGLLTRPKLLECLEAKGLLPSHKEEINLAKLAENNEEIDVWKHVSQDPFILLHRTPILTAHTVFRNMGLRHLCIVDEKHAIVSLVTRKDLCEVVEEFVSDYKHALKEFAEKIESSTHEIEKGASEYTLDSGGLPKGPVGYDTRGDLRQRRRDRANSEEEDVFSPKMKDSTPGGLSAENRGVL